MAEWGRGLRSSNGNLSGLYPESQDEYESKWTCWSVNLLTAYLLSPNVTSGCDSIQVTRDRVVKEKDNLKSVIFLNIDSLTL